MDEKRWMYLDEINLLNKEKEGTKLRAEKH